MGFSILFKVAGARVQIVRLLDEHDLSHMLGFHLNLSQILKEFIKILQHKMQNYVCFHPHLSWFIEISSGYSSAIFKLGATAEEDGAPR